MERNVDRAMVQPGEGGFALSGGTRSGGTRSGWARSGWARAGRAVVTRIAGAQGSVGRRRFFANLVALLVLPLGLALILGWNGVGMIKPWPARWVGMLYWLIVTMSLWWITSLVALGVRRLLGEPRRLSWFVLRHCVIALIGINIFRPLNIGAAWLFAGHFGLTTDRIALAVPDSMRNFLDWQIAFIPFVILWVGSALAVRYVIAQPTPADRSAGDSDAAAASSAASLGDYIESLAPGALVSVSAEDHYVRVHDISGADMRFRCSFSEALECLKDKDGFKVHRSHWVAGAHVEKLESTPTKASVLLSNGRRLPVSAPNRDTVLLTLARRPG